MGRDNKEYLSLKKELDNDPLLSNYELVSNEVKDYLEEIKDQIIKIK